MPLRRDSRDTLHPRAFFWVPCHGHPCSVPKIEQRGIRPLHRQISLFRVKCALNALGMSWNPLLAPPLSPPLYKAYKARISVQTGTLAALISPAVVFLPGRRLSIAPLSLSFSLISYTDRLQVVVAANWSDGCWRRFDTGGFVVEERIGS